MIVDHLDSASAYFNLDEGIRAALEYLRRTDIGQLVPGRHPVDGDRIFAIVSDYQTKAPEASFWEAHRRHVDVQYVHAGRERMGYGHLSTFQTEPYDAERDLIVASRGAGQFVDVRPGMFVVFFPHDVHMPGLISDGPSMVRKVVVKVRRP